MQGLEPDPLPMVSAVLAEEVASPAGLRHFLRGNLSFDRGTYTVTAAEVQGSHQLGSLATANSLIQVPEDIETLPAGSRVDVMRLPS